ncbi:MAG: ATP-dependent DNA helicase RecG [Bacilli bacterium]|nr:ATP-dependent DNA helicase RecG [Bacilli bacterium]MBN2877787.1 ATP-dependent DNA helicase RecG [Bacilli bacterium]
MNELKQIKGIGPKTVEKLKNAGIQTTEDLLLRFPLRYETHAFNTFEEIALETELTLSVKVTKAPKIFLIRKNLDKLSVEVEINQMFFHVHIFNRRFLSNALKSGTEIVITGRFIKNLSNFTASNIVLLKNFRPGIQPIYGIEDINDKTLNKAIRSLLEHDPDLTETIPSDLLQKHQIPHINDLIVKIHLPEQEEDILQSRKRIIYEELLDFALRIESLKKLNQNILTKKKQYDINLVRGFIATLPFELTEDQKQATNEIFMDLKNDHQMNRLLQGDVGSGKTIVSVIASLAVVTAGFQVAIMAPTLVLAKQHYEAFKQYLEPYEIRIGLLVSELSNSERGNIIDDIRTNRIKIIIGTHSLIQEDVDFHNLGFLVIDEQHRFGVAQRKELRRKGATPDILLMSATPIPRTLAISIYKDIDVSFIKEKPSGRKEIKTKIIEYERLNDVLKSVKNQLIQGHQAYIICPKIEESDVSNKVSVEEMADIIQNTLGKEFEYGVLHGKMTDYEKNQILTQFYSNQTKILISTTVVEVGVNVKNATCMVILNADTFGLAQLHQLRGRIGRDMHQSFCYLIVDDLSLAKERLSILEQTTDGFLISEYDLSLRGPGEVFGRVQSGIPTFKMANLIKDEEILQAALVDAAVIVSRNDERSVRLTKKAIKAIESYHLD